MKKTIMINLGGFVFHIDEDAFLNLSQYLENLKKHFGKQQGAQDILADIESRIAEILHEKRPEANQVITGGDVAEVIAIMGNPVEIDQEEARVEGMDSGRNDRGEKRFFRNPDEKVIAGICSGIGAYFHLDPVWVRLLFIVFFAAGGSGILVYLVLWIVVPEAKSTTDRLVMRGEKINITNIEKTIRVEMSDLGQRVGNLASESAATLKKAGKGSGVFFEMIGKSLVAALKIFAKILVFITGVMILLVGLGLLIAIVAYLSGWTGGIYSDNEFTVPAFPGLANLLVGCDFPVVYLQVILFVLLGIPAFMLFYNGLRMIFRFNRIKHLGLTMLNIWIIGLFFMTWSGFRIYNLYKYHEETQIKIALEKPADDTLHVMFMAGDPGLKYLHNEKFSLVDDQFAVITPDRELFLVPDIWFEETSDSVFSVTQVTMARGRTHAEARQHMAAIRFQSAANGSCLQVGPFARLPKEVCWRGERVTLHVHVPKGKFIRFDPGFRELRPYLYYMMNSPGDSLFQMTDSGIEAWTPGQK